MTDQQIDQLVRDFTVAVDTARAEELNGRDGSAHWSAARPMADRLTAAGAVITPGYLVTWPLAR
jgi:hypothetical protein